MRQSLNEVKGPRFVFADGTQSIYLADLSGDGLTDLVRIRNGEVCYWPNLGYARFGAKVTMDNAPWFDAPELFDQRRVRLADIDGSGTTDILYLGHNVVHIYFNQSGNGWSETRTLDQFPHIDNLSAVTAVDLLGNGTACLVWSSPLLGDVRRPMRYIDLMGGQKPHLLVNVANNLGAETHVQYAPSTRFYLADKLAGKPWITKLPFPVHVVERVETHDRISRNRFVTRYAYHHGYFDGVEREFRGFAMVEQRDTEEFAVLSASDAFPDVVNIDEASHVPPVLTKTWFHTGAYCEGGCITRQFEDEYYLESSLGKGSAGLTEAQLRAMLLDDTLLPAGLSSDEARQASRTLKGSVLRQEIYALDNTEEADHPYSISERNYALRRLQPCGENRHAVFFSHPRETLDFNYERKLFDIDDQMLADPRVTHSMTLDVDDFGNVLQSVAIGYGRRHEDPGPLLTSDDREKQKRTLITYTENRYTNLVLEQDAYRTPLLCETLTFEVLKLKPSSNQTGVTNLFRFEEMRSRVQEVDDGHHYLPYEDVETTGAVENHPYRRPIEHRRTLYRRNDLTGPLPLGQVQSLALPFESYKLAFTPGLLLSVYKRKLNGTEEELLPELGSVLGKEGRYVRSQDHKALGWFPAADPDDNWWIPSERVFYSPDTADAPPQEYAYGRGHFFLPHRYRDPFHTNSVNTESFVSYDAYDLLVQESRDALGNRITVGERSDELAQPLVHRGHDYRVLQPALVMDPNRNRSAVAFDALGMVVGSAVMGKPEDNPQRGDSLDGFASDLTDAAVAAHLQDPLADPHSILWRATTRLVGRLSWT